MAMKVKMSVSEFAAYALKQDADFGRCAAYQAQQIADGGPSMAAAFWQEFRTLWRLEDDAKEKTDIKEAWQRSAKKVRGHLMSKHKLSVRWPTLTASDAKAADTELTSVSAANQAARDRAAANRDLEKAERRELLAQQRQAKLDLSIDAICQQIESLVSETSATMPEVISELMKRHQQSMARPPINNKQGDNGSPAPRDKAA